MSQEIYLVLVNVRKYPSEDRMSEERKIVPITKRNTLPLERHMELPNLNDEEHIYLESIEDIFKIYNRNILSPFFWTYILIFLS